MFLVVGIVWCLVFCCFVLFFFIFPLCFFEGVPPSGDHLLSSEDAVGWPRRLGDDFVTIVNGCLLPVGISRGSLLGALGRQKPQIGRQEGCFGDFLGASK